MSQPNSTLTIYSGVPLDNTYQNTFNLNTSMSISNFLSTYTKITFSSMNWIRKDRNRVRVSTGDYYPDWYADYNYLSFNNSSKTYYCFITDCIYINDNTVEFEFEVDVMITYWHDISINDCYVERNHIPPGDDVIGANRQPEPFNLGTYECDRELTKTFPGSLEDTRMIIYTIKRLKESIQQTDAVIPIVNLISGYPSMYGIHSAPGNQVDVLQSLVDTAYDLAERVAMAFLIPSALWTPSNGTTPYSMYQEIYNVNTWATDNIIELKNKKLYNFPYTCLRVDNNEGVVKDFAFEDLSYASQGGQRLPTFTIYGSLNPVPKMLCIPGSYRGEQAPFSQGIPLENFPAIPVAVEGFQNWLATNGTAQAISLTGNILSQGIAAAFRGESGAAQSAAGLIGTTVGGFTDMIASEVRAGEQPMQLTPSAGGDPFTILLNKKGYTFRHMSVRADVFKRADHFLTRYGYAINDVTTPNISARPRFCYLKTRGATLSNNAIPTTAAMKICQILDRGITFWKDRNIGNYDGNN